MPFIHHILWMLILSGCAHGELGKYVEGQFQTDVNDSNFIKLYLPEPDDYNPKLDDFRAIEEADILMKSLVKKKFEVTDLKKR